MDIRVREIGSEFYECETDLKNSDKRLKDWQYYLSGRTALDVIIKDIVREKGVKKALLPGYCCDSMIKPFVENNIRVDFYDVVLYDLKNVEYKVKDIDKYDVLLIMDYFGLGVENFESRLKEIISHSGDCTIIVDVTHSWLSDETSFDKADYYFCSLRKWTGLFSGGAGFRKQGKLQEVDRETNYDFVETRKNAMSIKRLFINGQAIDKNIFLEQFNSAEMIIDSRYKDYGIDELSKRMIMTLDTETIIQKRRDNYSILLNAKNEFERKKITVLCDTLGGDVPLCFPVYVEGQGRRDRLRKYLIDNKVFCPVHWQSPDDFEVPETAKKFSQHELSIVCDQRYCVKDMNRIINLIKEYNG